MFKTLILASLLISSTSLAQQFKVERVKGNKAVIEYSGRLVPGQSYTVGNEDQEVSGSGGERIYVVGGSFNMRSLTQNNSNLNVTAKDNVMELIARFGWNLGHFEVGPIAGYTNIDSEIKNQNFSTFSFGAFADYNLTPNIAGETFLFGVGGEGTYSSISAASGTSSTAMGGFVSGFGKWFIFGPSTALRLDAGYLYEKASGNNVTLTLQGFNIRAGLATYF